MFDSDRGGTNVASMRRGKRRVKVVGVVGRSVANYVREPRYTRDAVPRAAVPRDISRKRSEADKLSRNHVKASHSVAGTL
jgi:hypothetical protein